MQSSVSASQRKVFSDADAQYKSGRAEEAKVLSGLGKDALVSLRAELRATAAKYITQTTSEIKDLVAEELQEGSKARHELGHSVKSCEEVAKAAKCSIKASTSQFHAEAQVRCDAVLKRSVQNASTKVYMPCLQFMTEHQAAVAAAYQAPRQVAS